MFFLYFPSDKRFLRLPVSLWQIIITWLPAMTPDARWLRHFLRVPNLAHTRSGPEPFSAPVHGDNYRPQSMVTTLVPYSWCLSSDYSHDVHHRFQTSVPIISPAIGQGHTIVPNHLEFRDYLELCPHYRVFPSRRHLSLTAELPSLVFTYYHRRPSCYSWFPPPITDGWVVILVFYLGTLPRSSSGALPRDFTSGDSDDNR